VLRASTITVRDARFRTQNVVLEKAILDLQPAPGEMETVAAFQKAVSETRRWVEPLARRFRGCMVSPYGVRRLHNGKPTGEYHRGIDQRAAAGQPVRAVAAGEVKIVRKFNLHGGHGGYRPWTGAGVDLPAPFAIRHHRGRAGEERRRDRLRGLDRALRPPRTCTGRSTSTACPSIPCSGSAESRACRRKRPASLVP